MRNQSGFTLVELVVTMVLLGIITLFTFSFIGDGANMFIGTVNRTELANFTRTLMLRLNREITNAIPETINVTGASQLDYLRAKYITRLLYVDTSDTSKIIVAVKDNIGDGYSIWYNTTNGEKITKIKDHNCKDHICTLTLESGITEDDLEQLDASARTLYIIDPKTCKRVVKFSSSSLQMCAGDTCTPVAIHGKKIKVKDLFFNLDINSQTGAVAPATEVKHATTIYISLQVEQLGEVMSVSQLMEVGNAP